MDHYIKKSQNKKLKKQVFDFFSKLSFGFVKLPFSGKIILFLSFVLLATLPFSWIELRRWSENFFYTAFSSYSGHIGFGIIIGAIIIAFFLLSHKKKEHFRSYVPFRLSDTQAIVFVSSLIVVAIVELIIISRIYNEIAINGVVIQKPLVIALASSIFMIISWFFLSKSLKEENTDMYYLHHDVNPDFEEYRDILHPELKNHEKSKKQNMTLPI